MNAERKTLDPVVRRFIEDAGTTTQSFGIGRVLGQIFAYLYFSPNPKNLSDMQEALGISKGSASTSVRQLEQWGAVRKVWVKGDRKDYYEANEWFGKVLKNALSDLVGTRMASYASLLDEIEAELNGISDEERDDRKEFLKARVNRLRQFQDRVQKIWNSPILKRLLK